MAIKVIVHNNVLRDSTPDTERLIAGIFERKINDELLKMVLTGDSSGTSEFDGLDNYSGVNSVDAGSVVLADYDKIVESITTTMANNAMLESIGSIVPINVAQQLNQLKTGIASDNSPLVPPDIFGKLKGWHYTTGVPETYESSTETRCYFGDFSQMIIGFGGQFELRSEHIEANSDSTVYYLIYRADLVLIDPAKFTILTDITLV